MKINSKHYIEPEIGDVFHSSSNILINRTLKVIKAPVDDLKHGYCAACYFRGSEKCPDLLACTKDQRDDQEYINFISTEIGNK